MRWIVRWLGAVRLEYRQAMAVYNELSRAEAALEATIVRAMREVLEWERCVLAAPPPEGS